MAKGRGAGKPCGASFISAHKTCRVSMPSELNKALNAAAGDVGARTLWAAVKAQNVRGNQARFHKIRDEVRKEMGGNVVKGPKADRLRQRLQEEGLLPKAKTGDQTKLAQLKAEREALRDNTALTAFKRRMQLADEIPRLQNKIREANKPDTLYGLWQDADLKKQYEFYKGLGDKANKEQLARVEKELARRQNKPESIPLPRQLSQSPSAAKRDSFDLMMSDISRLMRGESPQHIEVLTEEGGRFKSKSQIAQLQSVLQLGSATRKDVGRDLEALVNEAKDLRANIKAELQAAKPNTPKRAKLIKQLKEVEEAIEGPATKANAKTKYGREKARDLDDRIERDGITRQLGENNYKWGDSYASGSRVLGQGAFGTVIKEPGAGAGAVKRGSLGNDEARLVQKIGEADLGPRLRAAQLDGEAYHEGTRYGRMAMDVVPGRPIGKRKADDMVNGVPIADAYWTARANLHRMGIAHNDMHIDNVFVDKTGKGRIVDMGLAQDSPKAALAEALGPFAPPRGAVTTRLKGAAAENGDWQMRRWDGTGGDVLTRWERDPSPAFRNQVLERFPVMGRVFDNRAEAMYKMKRMGLNNDDIATIMNHGIRSKPESYTLGPWAKISDSQALEIINTLYEGV